MATYHHIRGKIRFLKDQFLRLNIFNNYSVDPVIIREQILSTRLFIVLFSISLSVLLLYSSISEQTISVTVDKPDQSTFEKLEAKYPDSLECPCTEISIPYGDIVRIKPTFHQVCTSDFVSQRWMDHVFGVNITHIWAVDLRTTISGFWQTISSLCQTAINTIDKVTSEFSNQVLISSLSLSSKSLTAKARADVDVVHQNAIYDFEKSINIIHRMSQANGYFTGTAINFVFAAAGTVLGQQSPVFLVDGKYLVDNATRWCECQRHATCPVPAAFYLYPKWETTGVYDLSRIVPNVTIPGLIIDCLPLQMIYGSSLECFYNQSCVDLIISMYPRSINISAMNSFLPSRFSLTDTMEIPVQELFLEAFESEILFTQYYYHCAPVQCSYIFKTRFEWVFVVTTIAALVGGLNVALRLLSPRLVAATFWVKAKWKSRTRQKENRHDSETSNNSRPDAPKRSIFRYLMVSILEFNLFEDPLVKDMATIQRSRITTRVYVIGLSVSMIVLIVYTSQSSQLVTKIIQYPTQAEYEELQQNHQGNLRCPCTTISIPYSELMVITPTFHQICTSDFIDPTWYQQSRYHWSFYAAVDFRIIGSSYFRTLAMFCEISNLTINAAYLRFSSTSFVNAQMIPRDSFLSQTIAFIEAFISSTKSDFVYQVSLINSMLHANHYVSGLETNAVFITWNVTEEGLINSRPYQLTPLSWDGYNADGTRCYCALDANCEADSSRSVIFQLPGIYTACYLVDIALQSTLQCWYDRNCILRHNNAYPEVDVPAPSEPTALSTAIASRFSRTTRFETIVNEALVEYFNYSSSFDAFYQKCRPEYCSYIYEERSSVAYIVTTVIGLFGGLNVVLRMLSIILIRLFKHQRANPKEVDVSTVVVIQTPESKGKIKKKFYASGGSWKAFVRYITELNLYKNDKSEVQMIRRQRVDTRVFIGFLFISITIIIIYTVLPTTGTTITIEKPSMAEYENLAKSNLNNLQCPCEKISIKHREFFAVNENYHRICSSAFIGSAWIRSLFLNSYWFFYKRNDIRIRGAAYFALLGELCALAAKSINRTKVDFLEERFHSSHIIPVLYFESNMNAVKLEFENKAARTFTHALGLFRNLTHGSTFISTYFLNWYGWIETSRPHATYPISPTVPTEGCTCGTRSDCLEKGAIHHPNTGEFWEYIPGLNVGCSVIETVLRSTLVCFYNQTCVNMIRRYFSMPTYRALNLSTSSRFNIESNIEEMVNGLFVEEWHYNISYAEFYSQCSPRHCSYLRYERKNILYMVTRILGLYGGLSTALHFFTPYFTLLVLTLKGLFRRQ